MKYRYLLTGCLCLAFWRPVCAANATTKVLAVNAFVENVLQANPQLKIRAAEWQAARARITQQSSLSDPQLSYRFAPMTLDHSGKQSAQRDLPFKQPNRSGAAIDG